MTCLIIVISMYLIAIFAPVICGLMGVDPYTFDGAAISDNGGAPILPWGGISPSHILGVEWGTGRDLFAQLLWGLRISLLVATSATFLTTFLGTVIGIIAGYAGGTLDTIIGRIMDLVLAFPFLLIILALSGVLTQRLTELGVPEGNPSRILYLILVISFFGWPYLARIVRGQVLSLREREFVEAAVAMGAGTRRILFGEILPNLWAPIIVYATLTLPAYIGLEAAHVVPRRRRHPAGDDVRRDARQLGHLLERRSDVSVHPRIVLVIIVVSFNLFGDALRDALDPKTVH